MPNKEVERQAKELHSDLLDDLSRDLGRREVKKFKERLRHDEYGGFRAREIEEMEDIEAIFTAQQKRKVFSVGKYIRLKEQLDKIKCPELVDEVRKYEGKLRNIGYPVIVRAESMDAAPSDVYTNSSAYPLSPFPPDTPTSPGAPFRKEPDVCYPAGRGYVLYISNFYHIPDSYGKPRPGVNIDKANISNFFKDGYDFEFCPDVKSVDKLWEIIDEVKGKIEHLYSSFFLIISSHGKGITLKDGSGNDVLDDEQKPVVVSEGIQLAQKDSYVRVDEIVNKFENFMLGKPKVLIFQACRSLTEKPDAASPVSFYDAEQFSSVTIPGNADMVILHDTSRGSKGWRNDEQGSWLFYYMFSHLKNQYKNEHLLDVLTRVNHIISFRDAHGTDGRILGKQMPCFTSTFTKFFYVK